MPVQVGVEPEVVAVVEIAREERASGTAVLGAGERYRSQQAVVGCVDVRDPSSVPDGVVIGRDDDGGVGRDCLLPMRLSRTGRHTFRIDARGEGKCELRLIPLD